MKTVIALWKWAQRPHWTNELTAAAFGLAVIVGWYLTGTFFRGVGVVVLVVAGWCVLRAVRWVEHRIRVTIDAGIPLSPIRMFHDLRTERAKFVEHDDLWALFTRAQGVKYDGQMPKLHRHKTTADGDVEAFVNLAGLGGNLDVIRRNVADGTLAGVMNCKEVSIRETKINRAWLTFYNHPPLDRPLGLVDLPVPRPGFVSFGIDEDGSAAEIEHGLSVLSIGETGSGKSKAMWNMFGSMLRSKIETEIDLFDPKRTELKVFKRLVGKRVGNILIRSYSQTLQEAEVVMARFVAEMAERSDRLEERQLTDPTADLPARYVWADELNELHQLYAKPDSLMVTLVSKGRSSKDALMGSVQVAKVANLGHLRDQVPINICMRTKTRENTKAALALEGDNIPPCHMIPRSTPGVGFYVTADGTVRKFRTAHVTDKQLDEMATEGKLPDGMVSTVKVKHTGPPCFVYIAPDKSGGCGYVGIAGGIGIEKHPVARRRAEHRRYDRVWCEEHEMVENWWVKHIADTRMEVRKYPSRAAALIAEERLIKDLKPRWNIQHNGANELSNLNEARRSGRSRRVLDAAGEYLELAREVQAVRQVKAGYAKQDRVAAQVEKRDRFVERSLEESYR